MRRYRHISFPSQLSGKVKVGVFSLAPQRTGKGLSIAPLIVVVSVLLGAISFLRPGGVVAMPLEAPAYNNEISRMAVLDPPGGVPAGVLPCDDPKDGRGQPRYWCDGIYTQPAITTTPVRPRPTTEPAADVWHRVGGIDLADESLSLGLSYPIDADWEITHKLENLRILVSDNTGANLNRFEAIGEWPYSVFVYPDTYSQIPVLSVHDGYYAGRQLEAEPLRYLIEGPLTSPYAAATIDKNLRALVGAPFQLAQGDRVVTLKVAQAIRMDAQTIARYASRAGELSTLLGPTSGPGSSVLVLICSARQPGEPNLLFPGRFLLELSYTRD